MPDIILPPAEQAPEYRLVLTATSTAQANGVDTNSATARLSRHGQASGGQFLVFTLSGNAVFTGDGQHIAVTTNSQGEATVYFTDTRRETVLVTCRYYQTQARENSRFVASPRVNTNISAQVIGNGAQADGIATNAMLYTVFDELSNSPLPEIPLGFTTTGSAVLSATTGTSNVNGQYALTLTNLTPQQVLVTAELPDAPWVNNYAYLQFIPAPTPAPIYLLSFYTNVDNALADGVSFNSVTFTLTRDGAPIANERLSFTTNPDAAATVSPATGTTSLNGQITVNITSLKVGIALLTAFVDSQPGVQPVNVILTFSPPSLLYLIADEVIRDHAPANGIEPNLVAFTVLSRANGTPQPGILLLFSVTGDAQLSGSRGTTGANGTFTLSLFNRVVENVRVTARVSVAPLAESNVEINFT